MDMRMQLQEEKMQEMEKGSESPARKMLKDDNGEAIKQVRATSGGWQTPTKKQKSYESHLRQYRNERGLKNPVPRSVEWNNIKEQSWTDQEFLQWKKHQQESVITPSRLSEPVMEGINDSATGG